MSDCIFCKIIAKEAPSKIIAENDSVLVIENIAPKLPIHYLILPKKHVKDVSELVADDHVQAGDLLMMAQQLSEIDSRHKSFRLVSNNGLAVGQSVFHIHLHFLAGKNMSFE